MSTNVFYFKTDKHAEHHYKELTGFTLTNLEYPPKSKVGDIDYPNVKITATGSIEKDEKDGTQSLAKITVVTDESRSAHSSYAKWFDSKVGKGHAVGCHREFDKRPDNLNFVFKCTLEFTYEERKRDGNYRSRTVEVKDAVIGQGHQYVPARNNWWLGGPDMDGVSIDLIDGLLESKGHDKHLELVDRVIFNAMKDKESNQLLVRFITV